MLDEGSTMSIWDLTGSKIISSALLGRKKQIRRAKKYISLAIRRKLGVCEREQELLDFVH